ncbi:hypothetical protein IQ22_00007 [Pseudomonas duriflava]|uniref:Uncharacterized protein n=1 Tax=Pseudomonas duriflava TaxID=459528 RepID=A0A562QNR1_9PSED|nr:hypothetical protein [Pseudomonas duriflava]TWI58303.1 hypothetical protein IQ22_00007 [Pseudomonas duriflava]
MRNNIISIKPQNQEDRETLEARLSFLQKASLRLLHRNGSKATLLVLERWRSTEDDIQVVFTPGIVEALGEKLDGRQLLDAAMSAAR